MASRCPQATSVTGTKRCHKAWSLGSKNPHMAACGIVEAVGAFAVGCRPSGRHRQQTGIAMICQAGEMDEARAAEVMAESAAMLRNAGARFAYLHGSRASGRYRPDSDIDIAAYFGGQPPNAFDILMPPA